MTKLCGVIGYPIEHSLSPDMHNAAFASLGLDYVYLAFPVEKGELEAAIKALRALNVKGLNVTTPHKVDVMRYLDSLDPTASAIGAVNTIDIKNDKLIGYNTDGAGALRSLEENVPDLAERRITLLGAGGAARAIAFCLANRCKSLTILNRTKNKAIELANSLRERFGFPASAAELKYDSLREALSETDVLIHATTVGMHPREEDTLVPADMLRPDLAVFDIVYNPLKTRLLKDAEVAGAKTISGVDMLVYQGAASFKIWTGLDAPVDVMKKTVLEKLSS